MGVFDLNSGKNILLVLLLILTINANADVANCSTLTPSSLQTIDTPNAQPQQETDKTKKTIKKQKAKSNSNYFGMFKLLIPDTLR
ncbi:MAG: hypothetical protein JKY19_03455 [Alcanivoracaceae bacterium]|nr:hypothetical protein [Alcanivoracaceae bacterium]